jgi:ParB/RepB/Spo0J family partition protein
MPLQNADGHAGKGGTFKGYMLSPSEIETDEGFNPRDMGSAATLDHIESLEASIKARGFDPDRPLLGYKREPDRKFVIVDGHCRFAAVRRLTASGEEIMAIPCRVVERGTSSADRLAFTLRDPGRPLTQLEQADAIKRLLGYGWREDTIAHRLGKSRQWVSNCLELAVAPEPVKAAVNGGEIAATEARKLVRHTTDPVAALDAAREVAKSRGSARIRQRDVHAIRAPEPRLDPAQKSVMRFLAAWDMMRHPPELPEPVMVALEAMRSVVP